LLAHDTPILRVCPFSFKGILWIYSAAELFAVFTTERVLCSSCLLHSDSYASLLFNS